jgi:hypothetical protein
MSGGFVLHTQQNGELATTTAEVDAIFADLANQRRIVLHFHGGLVNRDSGQRIAENLAQVYLDAGAKPVFFVWQSGVVEIISGNLKQIIGEGVFQRMLHLVLKFAAGKVRDDAGSAGARAIGDLPVPPSHEVDAELHARAVGKEPFAELPTTNDVGDLTDAERDAFLLEGESDGELQAHVNAPTLMSPEVVTELNAAGPAGARSFVGAALLVRKSLTVLERVIGRYRDNTDHGLYPTVVEELLRAFYLGSVGGAVWSAMKAETLDTFDDTVPARGGRLFLDKLEALLARPDSEQAGSLDASRARPAEFAQAPQLTLVGHSTGAVFIDHFLGALAERQKAGTIPAGFTVRNVVFLAPACTTEHFAKVVNEHGKLVDRFRMFTMDDEHERADRVLGAVYPRSLLYLVSGLLEVDGSESRCVPLTGLARYLSGPEHAKEYVRAVRQYVGAADQLRLVTSPSPADAPPGMRASAVSHGAFDNDPLVQESLRHMIME